MREELITETIAQEFEGLRIRPEVLGLLKEALREGHEEIASQRDETLRVLESRRQEAQARLDRLNRDRVDGEVPESTYRNLRPEYEATLAEVQEAIRAQGAAERTTWEDSLGLLESVSKPAAKFSDADAARRREMFKGMVSNCQIVDGKVAVTLSSWFKTLLDANREAEGEALVEGLSGNWYSGRDSNPRSSP